MDPARPPPPRPLRPLARILLVLGACLLALGILAGVLGGLVPGVLVCVPTSRGYGVADGGRLALHAALGSCAPGLVAVNIDNGFGAAGAALRALGAASG